MIAEEAFRTTCALGTGKEFSAWARVPRKQPSLRRSRASRLDVLDDIDVLLTSRLAPDMQPFVYQVQSACDYVKAAAAWLSQQPPPKHEDNERTLDELRARIRKTVAFVESVKPEQYARASEQKIRMSWAPQGRVLGGEDYLLQMSMPNAYFRLAMAYAIVLVSPKENGGSSAPPPNAARGGLDSAEARAAEPVISTLPQHTPCGPLSFRAVADVI